MFQITVHRIYWMCFEHLWQMLSSPRLVIEQTCNKKQTHTLEGIHLWAGVWLLNHPVQETLHQMLVHIAVDINPVKMYYSAFFIVLLLCFFGFLNTLRINDLKGSTFGSRALDSSIHLSSIANITVTSDLSADQQSQVKHQGRWGSFSQDAICLSYRASNADTSLFIPAGSTFEWAAETRSSYRSFVDRYRVWMLIRGIFWASVLDNDRMGTEPQG